MRPWWATSTPTPYSDTATPSSVTKTASAPDSLTSTASEHDHHEGSRKQLSTALSLLVDCATLYARTDEHGKRLANQAFTDGIEISEDEQATIRVAEPFAALAPAPTSADVRCSSTSSIVDVKGLEPLTFRV